MSEAGTLLLDNVSDDVLEDATDYKRIYLTFEGSHPFELYCPDIPGLMEYSYCNGIWSMVNAVGYIPVERKISLRGSNNRYLGTMLGKPSFKFMALNSNYKFDLKVKCYGNIMTLLDYKSVMNDIEPEMDDYCFSGLFYKCDSLVSAPILPATNLSEGCYKMMFYGCTSLKRAPKLTATELKRECYEDIFYGCTSLIEIPQLPKT